MTYTNLRSKIQVVLFPPAPVVLLRLSRWRAPCQTVAFRDLIIHLLFPRFQTGSRQLVKPDIRYNICSSLSGICLLGFFRTRTRTTRLMWMSSLVKTRLVCFVSHGDKIPSLRFIDWLQQDGHHEALSAGRDNEWIEWIGIVCNDALNCKRDPTHPAPKNEVCNKDFDRFLDVKVFLHANWN